MDYPTAKRSIRRGLWAFGAGLVFGVLATASLASAQTPSVPAPRLSATATPACNGTVINGFLVITNNGTPNATCPPPHDTTAPGPDTVYGLNLPASEYRLMAAGHPAHLPQTTTLTYAPVGGAAQGEGYVTVSVATDYRSPVLLNIPPGSASDTWVAAAYLPQAGVTSVSAVSRTAEWIGPGGLYTLSIDSAHSSLTLEQAAALLVPVSLSELQAQLSPTSTPQAPATGTGSANGPGGEEEVLLLGGGLMLLLVSLGLVRMALHRRG